jgi:uncharacterized membrane protein YfbV (UPF0208 family)
MNPENHRVLSRSTRSGRALVAPAVLVAAFACLLPLLHGAESASALAWRSLQNHDPGDVVWFKEVSVLPLPSAGAK